MEIDDGFTVSPYVAEAQKRADIKLCRDCRFCDVPTGGFEYAKCRAPENIKASVNLVTGEESDNPVYVYCETQRGALPNGCGPSAKFFAPKVTP